MTRNSVATWMANHLSECSYVDGEAGYSAFYLDSLINKELMTIHDGAYDDALDWLWEKGDSIANVMVKRGFNAEFVRNGCANDSFFRIWDSPEKPLKHYNVTLNIGVDVYAANEDEARELAWEMAKDDIGSCFVDNEVWELK